MKTRITPNQRRALRDYISTVGVGKAPVILLPAMVPRGSFLRLQVRHGIRLGR
jgi:hypothetical protein